MGFAGYARYWQGIKYRRQGGSQGSAPSTSWTTTHWCLIRPNAAAGSFPTMVWPLRASGIGASKSDGTDIRFELPDGTKLDHLLDSYDPTGGELRAWVRIPAFDGRSGMRFRILAGNASATDQQASGNTVFQDVKAAWDLSTGSDLGPNALHLTVSGGTVASIDGWKARNFDGVDDILFRDPVFLDGIAEWSALVMLRAADAAWGDRGIWAQGPIGSGSNPDAATSFKLTHRADYGQWLAGAKDSTGASGYGRSAATAPHTIATIIGLQRAASQRVRFVIDGNPADGAEGGGTAGPIGTIADEPFHVGVSARDYWKGDIGTFLFMAFALPIEMMRAMQGCWAGDAYWFAVGPAETVSSGWKPIACRDESALLTTETADLDPAAVAFDPDGNTVSVTDAGTPPSGSAAIVGGKVRYTPGAAGTHDWNATLSDGAQTSTAALRVVVTSTGSSPEYPDALRTINVANSSELASALASAQPGDHIVLAAGSYGAQAFGTSVAGTQANPIVIRAASKLTAALTDNLSIRHPWYILWGIDFDNAQLKPIDGVADLVVRRCRARNYQNYQGIWCRVKGPRVTFDRCELTLPVSRGIAIDVANGGTDALIDRCHFHDWGPTGADQTFEPIQFGFGFSSSDLNCNSTVRKCLFETINPANNERECISIKSSGNRIEQCHLKDGRYLMIRHGENNRIEGCRLETVSGPKSTRVGMFDRNNKLLTTVAPQIYVFAGDVTPANFSQSSEHPAAENAKVVSCNGACKVGVQEKNSYTLRASGTSVEAHTGAVTLEHEQNTTQPGTPSETGLPTITLTTADVGPNAP